MATASTTPVPPVPPDRTLRRTRVRGLALAAALVATCVVPLSLAGSPAGASDTAPASGSGPVDGCGEAPTNPELWECSFADHFDGTELDRTKWDVLRSDRTGYTNGPECYFDRPENIRVSDGRLQLTAREEAQAFTCDDHRGGSHRTKYTGASVMTMNRFSQTFGRFEFRVKPATTDDVPGLHSAFWLWPDNPWKYGPWPYTPEMDVAEGYSRYSDRMIPFIHYAPDRWDPNVTNNYCVIPNLGTEFHTFVMEWTPQGITVLYDGKVCIDMPFTPSRGLTPPAPFDHPYFMAMNQSLGKAGTVNAFDAARTPLPATTEVDWVKVWRYVGDGAPTTTTTSGPSTSTSTTTTSPTTTVAPTTTMPAPAPAPTPSAPSTPTDVTVDLQALTATVTSAPLPPTGAGATGFIAECTSPDGGATRSAMSSTPGVIVRWLTQGSTYTCRLQARNVLGTSPWSEPSAAFRTPTKPAAPSTPTVVGTGGGTAKVHFTPGDDGGAPVTYTAWCSSTNGGDYAIGTSDGPPVILEGLTPGRTYICKARAANVLGAGPTSAPSARTVI